MIYFIFVIVIVEFNLIYRKHLLDWGDLYYKISDKGYSNRVCDQKETALSGPSKAMPAWYNHVKISTGCPTKLFSNNMYANTRRWTSKICSNIPFSLTKKQQLNILFSIQSCQNASITLYLRFKISLRANNHF